jgi:hypothetical protein
MRESREVQRNDIFRGIHWFPHAAPSTLDL